MKFEIESFEDLAQVNTDKLRKLRDIADDYHRDCATELRRAAARVYDIEAELRRREWRKGDEL